MLTAGAVLILGHARGTPETMQRDPRYDDALAEVGDELAASLASARAAGVADEQVVVDPGIGFGKRLQDNLALLARAGELRDLADAARTLGLTRARVTQIANLLLLAPMIQEAILSLSPVTSGRDPVSERALRGIVAEVDWNRQLELWNEVTQ